MAAGVLADHEERGGTVAWVPKALQVKGGRVAAARSRKIVKATPALPALADVQEAGLAFGAEPVQTRSHGDQTLIASLIEIVPGRPRQTAPVRCLEIARPIGVVSGHVIAFSKTRWRNAAKADQNPTV